jgi:hypothetical protein
MDQKTLRLDCLKLAMTFLSDVNRSILDQDRDVVKIAQRYYDFIKGKDGDAPEGDKLDVAA